LRAKNILGIHDADRDKPIWFLGEKWYIVIRDEEVLHYLQWIHVTIYSNTFPFTITYGAENFQPIGLVL